MGIRLTILILLCSLVPTGCIMIPVPAPEKLLEGKEVEQEKLDFLVPNVTTKEEVIKHLGQPYLIWEEAHLFAYDWVMRCGYLLVAVGGGGGGAGVGGGAADALDIPRCYVLLIQFDEYDRVLRFEKVVRSCFLSYGDFLKEWVCKHHMAVDPKSPDPME